MKLHASLFSRSLAIVALLCVFGLQTGLTHDHATHDVGTAECVACKSSSTGVVSLAPTLDFGEFSALAPVVEATVAVRATAISLYDSRGPPHFS